MKKTNAGDIVLGVYVSDRSVEAVLLQAVEENVRVVNQFSRGRVRQGQTASTLATALPGLQGSENSDFTIQVGTSEMDTADEFFLADLNGAGKKDAEVGTPSGKRSSPFATQLVDILNECAALGYPNPQLAFCVGEPDVAYVKLWLSASDLSANGQAGKGQAGRGRKADATEGGLSKKDRRTLLQLLTEKHTGTVDAERVSFLPMAPTDNQRRYLAVVAETSDAVTTTLEHLFTRHKATPPPATLMDAEATLYTNLIQKAYPATVQSNTALVRVGGDDTMILFLRGGELTHYERIRSLTLFDPPETICSRVLLQQDEQKIGALHRVLVLGESRGDQLLQGFRKFFAGADVEMFGTILNDLRVQVSEDLEAMKQGTLSAIGVGLRVLRGWEVDRQGDGVNLLPRKMVRKLGKPRPWAWHTFAMMAVLFAVTFFGVQHYMAGEAEIQRQEAELALIQPAAMNPQMLQHRIDSLQTAYVTFTNALKVLDSLLVGSDRWTRSLEHTTEATGDITGLWLKGWTPEPAGLRIEGNALSQARVVSFAREMEASIQKLTSARIGPVRVYSFTMVMQVPNEMPAVALYLQENAEAFDRGPGVIEGEEGPGVIGEEPAEDAASGQE